MHPIEQPLQKFHLPHLLMILLASVEFKRFLKFSFLPTVINVKKGQGKATEASGFREIVVDAEEHPIILLNPPRDWNLK